MSTDPETVAYLQRLCRLWPDDELRARADDSRWILRDDDGYTPAICEQSRTLNLAWITAIERELERRSRLGLTRGSVATGWPRVWLDELKARVSLADIAADYLELKPAGRAWTALCPLHVERTPSFVVFPDSRFHCFGCHQSGDVIAFMQAVTHMEYSDAVRFLADRAGLPLPARQAPRPASKAPFVYRRSVS